MRLAARQPGHLEPVAHLDALDRLDAHERLGQQAVEPPVPVHVAAQAHGHAVGQHLDDAAQAVARLRDGLDLVDHRLLGRRVEAAQGRGVDPVEVVGPRPLDRLRPHRPQLHHVRDHLDAEA